MEQDSISYQLRVEKAAAFLASRMVESPEFVIILGTGLGSLAGHVETDLNIPYKDIPYFPKSNIAGHAGNLILGTLVGRSVAILQGRSHYYEGYSTKELTLPLRVLSQLGASVLIVSNAAGGLNPGFVAGSLMIIRDHINFIPDNPLRGANVESWGPRFPDLARAYDNGLIELASLAANQLGIENIGVGVYGAIPGPSLETPAETAYLRQCGLDAVGMSTVPEVIVARHAAMRVLGVSVITNVNDPENFKPLTVAEVISCSEESAGQLTKLIASVISEV